MEYRPPGEREPDSQYRLLLDRIVSGGVSVPTRQGPAALTLMQQTMRFDLANGFPLITERSLKSFWRKSIGELCAFINGATTLDELAEFGCDWWGPWATPEKTSSTAGLPPGSLGPGLLRRRVPRLPDRRGRRLRPVPAPGGADHGAAGRPDPLRLAVDPAVPGPRPRARRRRPRSRPATAGCTCGCSAGGLHLHMFQRSGDVPVGVPANMIQYAALLLMLEQLTGIPAVAYYHTISDAHVYENQRGRGRGHAGPRAAAAAHGPAHRGRARRSPTSTTSAPSTSRSATTTRTRRSRPSRSPHDRVADRGGLCQRGHRGRRRAALAPARGPAPVPRADHRSRGGHGPGHLRVHP